MVYCQVLDFSSALIEVYGLLIITIDSLQGCTATVLLVWVDNGGNFFAQCANVGDSSCLMKYVFLFLLFQVIGSLELLWYES